MKKFIPTLARYLLLILATRIASGGFLPPEVAQAMATDPVLLEAVTSTLTYLFTLAWFLRSKAAQAIGDS